MKEYTIARATGEILQNSIGNQLPNLTLFEPGCFYVEGLISNATHYLLDKIATPYPVMPVILDKSTITADAIDTATISEVPLEADYYFNDMYVGKVTDELIEVTSDVPKDFKIKLRLFPYLDWEETINAI